MKANIKWNNEVDTFIHFFAALDCEGLSSVFKDDVVYDELSKQEWLALFDKQFESFKRNNIHYLKPVAGICSGCKKGCSGYTFLDEVNGFYIDIVFEVTKNGTIDFTECVNLKNEMKVAGKKEQIFINELGEINDSYQCPF